VSWPLLVDVVRGMGTGGGGEMVVVGGRGVVAIVAFDQGIAVVVEVLRSMVGMEVGGMEVGGMGSVVVGLS
jgi:hypothetical protein